MLRCAQCNHVTVSETTGVCSKCGHIQREGMKALLKTRSLFSPGATAHVIARDKHTGRLALNEVAIYLMDLEEPLITTVTSEVILGRSSRIASVTDQPAIDLTPYQGVERGVSRAHAALRRYGDELAVLDMGSTNGTWLNNTRLTPNMPLTVQNGDRIVLAKLTLHLFFETN